MSGFMVDGLGVGVRASEGAARTAVRLKISRAAAGWLEHWADLLLRGELQLWQLPPSVQSFVSIGWADGIANARRQAAEYEHQLDLAYMQLVVPRERQHEYARRLDEYFEKQSAAFFAAADGLQNGAGSGGHIASRSA